MKQMKLISYQRQSQEHKYADAMHKAHYNILDYNFNSSTPYQVWIGEVTYVRIRGAYCYLAVVLGLYAHILLALVFKAYITK